MGFAHSLPLSLATPVARRARKSNPVAARPGIAFTGLAQLGDDQVLVSFLASSIQDAMAKTRRLAAEASAEAQKFEMRGEDDEDEKQTQILWDEAVERAGASISSLKLWVGHHACVPPCPPVGAIA